MNLSTILMICAIVCISVIPSFKTRVISIRKVFIMPVLFLILFIEAIHTNLHLNLEGYVLIAISSILGVTLGFFLRRNAEIEADRKNNLIKLKGSYFGLILFACIFAAEFIFHFLLQTHPEIKQPGLLQYVMLFILSIVSLISAGASFQLLLKYVRFDECLV